MNGKAQCVFQFLTSILISSGQIVQYVTLIYFYGGGSPPVRLRRRRGERNMTMTSKNLTFLLFSTGLVNSNCFYLCQDNMNNIKLYFLKITVCMLLAPVSHWILKIAVTFSCFWVSVHLTWICIAFFILHWLDNSSNITIFQQTKVWVTTVVTAYQM